MRYFFVLSLAFLASVAAAQSVSDVVHQLIVPGMTMSVGEMRNALAARS